MAGPVEGAPRGDPGLRGGFQRGEDNGPGRRAVWATNNIDGLALWSARLPLRADQQLKRRLWRFPQRDTLPWLEKGENQVALVEAQGADTDRLLLATPRGLWLVKLPDDSPQDEPAKGTAAPPAAPLSVNLVNLMRDRELVLNVGDAPGVVFLPADYTGSEEACGTTFVACRDRTAAGEVMYAVSFSSRGRLHEIPYSDFGSVPLSLVPVRRASQVLGRAGGALVVSDLVGNQSRTFTNEYLAGAQRIHPYGRLVVCTGTAAVEGQVRWFTLLHNLEEENSIVDHAVTADLGSHPVLLGRNLFTIEPLVHTGRPALWLTRRRLNFRRRHRVAAPSDSENFEMYLHSAYGSVRLL